MCPTKRSCQVRSTGARARPHASSSAQPSEDETNDQPAHSHFYFPSLPLSLLVLVSSLAIFLTYHFRRHAWHVSVRHGPLVYFFNTICPFDFTSCKVASSEPFTTVLIVLHATANQAGTLTINHDNYLIFILHTYSPRYSYSSHFDCISAMRMLTTIL